MAEKPLLAAHNQQKKAGSGVPAVGDSVVRSEQLIL